MKAEPVEHNFWAPPQEGSAGKCMYMYTHVSTSYVVCYIAFGSAALVFGHMARRLPAAVSSVRA